MVEGSANPTPSYPRLPGDDRRVDADYVTAQADQRSAGVSRIDGRIRLQETLKLVPNAAAVLGADDSRRHGGLQTKRAADSQHPVAHLHSIRISQPRRRQIFPRIDLQHREVGVFVHAHYFCGVASGFTVQLHLNLGGLVYHVVVREDVSALVHDDAGAQAALGLRRAFFLSIEKLVKEILHRIIWIVRLRPLAFRSRGMMFHHLRGSDVHHRRLHAIHNAGERIRSRNGIRDRQRRGIRSRKSRALHRGHPSRNHGTDQYPYYQRQGHKKMPP